jgi:hypothetical protein
MVEPCDYYSPNVSHYTLVVNIEHSDGGKMTWCNSLPLTDSWNFSIREFTNPPSYANDIKSVRLVAVERIEL